jgi:hypothetical protein
VGLGDSAAAAALAARAPQAGGLREAAAAVGIDAVQTEAATYPAQNPLWAALEPVLAQLPEGGFAGPLRAPEGWLLVQLLSKTESVLELESLPAEMRTQLEHEALEMARANRMAAITDSLRRVIPVQVYPERLRKVAWPAPSGPAPQPG